jgi:hypothetical protein
MKSETRKRSEIVSVRMTPAEKAEATAFAAAHGKSLPEMLRLCLGVVALDEAQRAVRR